VSNLLRKYENIKWKYPEARIEILHKPNSITKSFTRIDEVKDFINRIPEIRMRRKCQFPLSNEAKVRINYFEGIFNA